MSKKRVHEIAKELKDNHSIELDNKAMVDELKALGYDVKSHSSSLEDDQAIAAVQRIVEKRKPKAAPAPIAAKGFVVRRKVGEAVQTTMVAAPLHPPHHHEPAAPAAPAAPVAEPPPVVAQAAPEAPPAAEAAVPSHMPAATPSSPAVEVPPAGLASAPASPTVAVESPPAVPAEAATSVEAAGPPAVVAAAETVEAPAAQAVEVPAGVIAVAPAIVATPAAAPAVSVSPGGGASVSAPARVAPPMASEPPRAPMSSGQSRPPMSSGQSRPSMSSSQSRPPMSQGSTSRPGGPMSRPQSGPPQRGGPGTGPIGSRGPMVPRPSTPGRPGVQLRPAGATATGLTTPAPGSVPGAPTRPLMPTATQAVVVSRPLIPIKRVTPSQPGSRYPMAPGKKAIGAVREFKVVPNQFGGGQKDFVDVSRAKEKERRGAGGVRRDKEKETTSTTDIRELIFGRVAIPVRGKKKKPTKKGQKTLITEMAGEKKVIKVQDGISVSELSQRMGVKTTDLIKKLMTSGKMVTANQMIDVDTATLIATDYGWVVKKVGMEVEDFLPKIDEKPDDFVGRPPVVTVMGHVDHGKTSLLDAIRSAKVAEGETGGITQHVGAYTVKSSQGDITFLDTPGHEAFSAMRARGANITDVVVLVVAADDGVMPQTKEAIAHAQKAEVPIVVAVNKMDLPGANIDRVKKELADAGLLAEDWGGEVIMVPVSAKTRLGLDLLLENISLQSEVLELKANPKRPAVGTILEARLEKGRGPIATILVQEGTLERGDAIVSGIHAGRVRMMLNDRGELIDRVLPGYSAEVIGLSGVPTAGDVVNAVEDEKAAKQIVDHRLLKLRQAEAGKTSRETLEDLLNKRKSAEQKELKVVLKADVSGSLEAVADAINKLSTKKVKVTIVQKGVGMMTETDIGNAAAFGAVVFGFNSKPESGAEAAAKHKEVSWQTFGIIYELLAAIITMMEDLLEPIRTEKKLGKAEVRNLFNVPKLGTIAGSAVTEGVIKRSAHLRLWRQDKKIFEGKLASLRRFKDDVKEVAQGYECGIGIDGFSGLMAGDVIEAYEIEETRPSLS
jgi:translation initiation factor IF-2